MIKTTTITLLEYTKDGIEWTDLPKTFQEAIMLTRKLGVYYIWIDSLCELEQPQTTSLPMLIVPAFKVLYRTP